MKRFLLLLFVAIQYKTILSVSNFRDDLTISIEARKTDCFFQHATEGQNIDIEYQVIDGGHGNLDIAFIIAAPNGRILVSLSRRQSGVYRGKAGTTGDYRFCFDNTHSHYNSKTVYFDLFIDNDSEEDDDDDEHPNNNNNENAPLPSEDLTMIDPTLELLGDGWARRIGEAATRVHESLLRARRLQETSAARASRDQHTADKNLFRVSLCSIIQALAMLLVGGLQVFMVRSLFDESSRVHGILKKITNEKS